MTYEFIESLYKDKPDLFLPYTDDSWLDDWIHTWFDNFDDAYNDPITPEYDFIDKDYSDSQTSNQPTSKNRFHPWLEDVGYVVKYWPNTPKVPIPDAYGFHLPFHVSRDYHGIYLIEERCRDAEKILADLDDKALLAGHYRNIVNAFVYYHEAFHHKVEMFAYKLELIVREKCFLGPVTEIYQEQRGKTYWQEEALANIHGYFKAIEFMNKKLKNTMKQEQLSTILINFIRMMPVGYCEAAEIIAKADYKEENLREMKFRFWERIQQRYLPNSKPFSSNSWQASLLDYPHNKKNGRLNFLISKDSGLLHRMDLNGRFLSSEEFVKRMKKYCRLEFKRQGKGSHEIWVSPSGNQITIPKHKALKIGTLGNMLKSAGLDISVHDFLRG